MVVFFDYPVGVCGPVPAVEGKLPGRRVAPFANHQLFLSQQLRRRPNPGQHSVVRAPDRQPAPAQLLQETGRRRVGHHLGHSVCSRQSQQIPRILAVCFLPALGPGVVVIFRRPVPYLPLPPPQAKRGRIHRSVIAGNSPFLAVLRCRFHPALIPKIIDQPFRGGPLSQHEPAVKAPLEHPRIPFPHLRTQTRIVLHGKMQVEHFLFCRPAHPFPVKPVGRALGITAKPQFAPGNGTAGGRLLHKRARHQRRFIQQDPGQCNALNQGGASLVASAVEKKDILPPPKAYRQPVLAAPFPDVKSHLPQGGQDAGEQIALHRRQRAPAQGKLGPLIAGHRPTEEGQAKTECFPASYRAVA